MQRRELEAAAASEQRSTDAIPWRDRRYCTHFFFVMVPVGRRERPEESRRKGDRSKSNAWFGPSVSVQKTGQGSPFRWRVWSAIGHLAAAAAAAAVGKRLLPCIAGLGSGRNKKGRERDKPQASKRKQKHHHRFGFDPSHLIQRPVIFLFGRV